MCYKIVLEDSEHHTLENGSILSAGIILFGVVYIKAVFVVVFSSYTGESAVYSVSPPDTMGSWSIHAQGQLFEMSP